MVNKRGAFRPIRVTLLLGFFLVAMACLAVPLADAFALIADIRAGEHQILLNKGAYCLLGVALALGGLLVDGVQNVLLQRRLAPSLVKAVSRVAVGGIVLAFLLPPAMQLGVGTFLTRIGYTECASQSRIWSFTKPSVYASRQAVNQAAGSSGCLSRQFE